MADPSANAHGRRPRRSKADIVDAALGILDDQGLPDLTMRRIGEVLGVQASALYWHFPNKQTLLAAVSARILAPMDAPSTASEPSLPHAAAELGTRLRDCLLSHRDAAELVSSSLALGLIEPPLHARLAQAARRDGEPEDLARTAAEAITHFVIGHVFHEQQRRHADALGLLDEQDSLHPSDAARPSGRTPEDFAAVMEMIGDGISADRERRLRRPGTA